MSEIKKVTLPKEVAEAIEFARGEFWGEADLMDISNFLDTNYEKHERINGSFEPIADFIEGDNFEKNLPIYMSALVNGYEVEQTPEEKVREYYEGLKREEDMREKAGYDGSQFRQGWQSIEKTLELLGIKIEGVNA